MQSFENALKIDAEWKPARLGLEKSEMAYEEQTFQSSISKGFQFLANGSFDDAERLFNQALLIRQDSKEAQQALDELNLKKIASLTKSFKYKALIAEVNEEWNQAKGFYEEILVIDDLSTGKNENLSKFSDSNKIKFVNKKVEDIQNLGEVFDGYDFCYHLAAGVGVQYIMENLSKSLLTNILATHEVFEACKEHKIPVLVTSTSEVYGVSEDEEWTEESRSLIGPTTKLRWSYAASKMIDEFLALSEYEEGCLLYTSPSPRDATLSRMPSSA